MTTPRKSQICLEETPRQTGTATISHFRFLKNTQLNPSGIFASRPTPNTCILQMSST
ncbi:MAG: hypothetical protein KZQ95_19585 [Candidatus Thiodiazotropha sp. (ex Epidulcina cf. delphinae)]|nr:hypothetical protein [Candidatus Thiodiazotropha sp. (ex Epidulcina cf. delphinae)]